MRDVTEENVLDTVIDVMSSSGIQAFFMLTISVVAVMIAVLQFRKLFAETRDQYQLRKEASDDFQQMLETRLYEFNKNLKSSSSLNENEVDKIVEQVSTSVGQKVVEKKLDDLFGDHKKVQNLYNSTETAASNFEELLTELSDERETVSNRSAVNLRIGVVIATVGAGLLLYFVLSIGGEANTIDWWQFFARFSIVVILQLFSYFFLNLYRIGLNDIKFYRNEVTNVRMMKASLISALQTEDSDLVKSILVRMSETERNFILKKGETSAAFAQNQSETMQEVKIYKMISEILSSTNPQREHFSDKNKSAAE